MVHRTFLAVVHKEDDMYVAQCPEVGTASQGYTLEEAVANLREATELYLEEEPAAVQRTGEVTVTLFEADVLTPEKQNP
jgi:predicted RNase H-like HicB family nuclease